MILRDLLQVLPSDRPNILRLRYFNRKERPKELEVYITMNSPEPEDVYSFIMLEHFADDYIMELRATFNVLEITLDRKLSDETVLKWKTAAADKACLPRIYRDWEY